jgi:hypothetical protein
MQQPLTPFVYPDFTQELVQPGAENTRGRPETVNALRASAQANWRVVEGAEL